MDGKVYENIIKDSNIAYFKGDAIRNLLGEYDDLIIIDFNKAFSKLLRLNDRERFYKSIKDIILKNEMDIDLNQILREAELNKSYKITSFIKKLDIILRINIYKLEESNMYSITIEKDDDKNNMKLSHILRYAPIYSWIKDIDGNYVDINNRYGEALGLSYYDIIGKDDVEIWGEDIGRIFKEHDNEVIKKGEFKRFEEQGIIKDNEKIILDSVKWPWFNNSGEITGSMGVSIQMTDKEKVMKKIEENEQNFMEILSNSEEVFMIGDMKKALYISPSFEKMFETKPNKVYEDINVMNDIFSGESFEKRYCYNKDDISESIEKIQVKDGKIKWIWSRFVPIKDEKGETIKRVGTFSDITHRKKLEEEKEQLRMDFFANISHELRTPINLIMSTLQVLNLKLKKLENEDKEYFYKYMKILEQNGFRLLKLVNNLIDITKMDSGYFKLELQNCDIVNFVEGICMSVSDFIKNNNMEIIFDTELEEKVIAFDLDKVERIILNLLSNAVKFNKANEKIEVYINYDECVKIRVKDNGIGIPQDRVEGIFGRFEQVKNKEKREKEGSGIGLSLVKSLADLHNGTIEIKSTLGEGTEFIVSLPDILVDTEISMLQENMFMSNQVHRMNVEFSDIY